MKRRASRGAPRRRTEMPAVVLPPKFEPSHVFSEQAIARLEVWTVSERTRLSQAMEPVESPILRELVQRVILAGNLAGEVLRFVSAIAPMTDDEAYSACAVPDSVVEVSARLSLAVDPLACLRVLRPELLERRRRPRKGAIPHPGPLPLPEGEGDLRSSNPFDSLIAERTIPHFDGPPEPDSLSKRLSRKTAARELGISEEPTFSRARRAPEAGPGEELLNAATRALGVQFEERVVDGPSLKLEQALDAAARALSSGTPVPVVLGRELGDLQRYALLLQVRAAPKARAFQLYDPTEQQVVWVHEADLLRRSELPFDSKSFRRITAIALPRSSKVPA